MKYDESPIFVDNYTSSRLITASSLPLLRNVRQYVHAV